jgi:hypothetical protein
MRNNTSVTIAIAVLAIALAATTSVNAQILYGQPTAGSTGIVMTHWKATVGTTETDVDQLFFPITGFLAVRDNFDISVYAGSANSTLGVSDVDYDLNGFGDALIQANHSFANDRLLLSAGVNIPSGKKKLLVSEESRVLDALSQDYLDFPSRRLGEGFGFNVLLGGATMFTEAVRGGAAIRYQYRGEYTPYENYFDYNAGDVMSFTAGVDMSQGSLSLGVDANYATYTADQLAGYKTFKQSPHLDLRLSAGVSSPKIAWGMVVGGIMRGDNKEYDTSGTEISALKRYGNEFSVGTAFSWMPSKVWTLGPTLDLRFIGANDAGLDKSTIFGAGGSVSSQFSKNLGLELGGKYYTGSADDGDIDLSGYQLTFGLTASM